jgi:hypothetical protein
VPEFWHSANRRALGKEAVTRSDRFQPLRLNKQLNLWILFNSPIDLVFDFCIYSKTTIIFM